MNATCHLDRQNVETVLRGRTAVQSTEVSMTTQPQGILGAQRFGPSESLANMFRACSRDLTETISQRLRDMFHVFMQHHCNSGNEGDMASEIAVKYWCQTEALYYRLLEAIISQEKRRLGGHCISSILEHDVFQQSVVVCCLEIVTFLHHSPSSFPLLLHTFHLPPYHFYKVIELVLRAEEGLPPTVVRHLSQVEGKVLENLAWTRDSPLWHSIRAHQGPLPACQQVMLPRHFKVPECADQNPNRNSSHKDGSNGNLPGGVSCSPAMVHDRYITPSAGSQMTSDLSHTHTVRKPHTTFFFQPGQTVVTMAAATVTTNSGQLLTIPVKLFLSVLANPIPTQQQGSTIQQCQRPIPVRRPRRTSSLSLFLRKVYALMSRRLRDLCSMLGISDELCVKIWTCFEHSLVHCTELMLDHHLDQLLMCAIYVMCRITKEDMTFKRIMKCYKTQPHASNGVCKNVLISGVDSENSPAGTNRGNKSGYPREGFLTPSTPSTHYPGPGLGLPNQEDRGNLIYFYNQVYIRQMNQFALRFSPTSRGAALRDTPPLTPFPREWKGPLRRLRPSSRHSLYVSPLNRDAPSSTSSRTTLLYHFNEMTISSTCLREINNMIRTGKSPTRRRRAPPLEGEEEEREEESGPPVKRLRQEGQSAWQRRLRTLVRERTQSQTQRQGQPPPAEPSQAKANLHK